MQVPVPQKRWYLPAKHTTWQEIIILIYTTKRKPSSNLIETVMTYIMVLSWTDKTNYFKLGNLAVIQTKYFQNTGCHHYCYKNMLNFCAGNLINSRDTGVASESE
jgi:hypothetical protein